MSTITASESIQAWLGQVKERTEIRALNGEVLGTFEPRRESEEEKYERAKTLFDPTEIERRMASEKDQGYAFEQVMEHLRSLGAEQ